MLSLCFSAHGAYSLSKLCDIIFTLQLHKWLQQQGSNIKVSSLQSVMLPDSSLARCCIPVMHVLHSRHLQRLHNWLRCSSKAAMSRSGPLTRTGWFDVWQAEPGASRV